jgi:hypothetical protein
MTAPNGAASPQETASPAGETVELRVHGVHGTSPASMLGLANDDVVQVAGDGLTGVFRPRQCVSLPGRDLSGTTISVEAYSWAALTSGVKGALGWVKRALWLLLLPFALANLSYWARLRLAEDTGTARWGARATRLGALLLTVFFILTPSLLGIDLVAWQCYRGGSPGCSLPGALDFLGRISAGQRLAVGCLVPLTVVGLLWALSRTTLQRYEESGTELAPGNPGGVLRHPKMWQGAVRTRQQQRVHLTVALAVVVAFSGVHVLAVDTRHPVAVWLMVLAAVGLSGLATGWSLVIHPDDIDYFEGHRSWIVEHRRKLPTPVKAFLRDRLPEVLLWAMVAVTALHLLGLVALVDPLLEDRDFAGHNLWFIAVFVALTAVHLSIFTGGRMPTAAAITVVITVFLLAGLAVAIHLHASWLPHGTLPTVIGGTALTASWTYLLVWHYRRGTSYANVAWKGAGASVLLAAAAWVSLLFTTGVVTMTANYLNGGDHGVSDLVSRSSVKARAAAQSLQTEHGNPGRFVATGEVTADRAIVHLVGRQAVVVSGSLRMESLYQPSTESSGPRANLARALDSTRLFIGHVTVPTRLLTLTDSCVRSVDSNDSTCSAEDADFVPAGALPLPAKKLTVSGDGGPVTLAVSKPPQMPLVVPQVLIWSPIIQLVWLLMVAAYLVAALLRFRRSSAAIDDRLTEDLAVPVRDRSAARKARYSAAFAHRAERLLDGIGAITALLALALIALSGAGQPPWDLWEWTRSIATLAMWVAALLALGLVYLGSQMRTSDSTRRALGVLWDLTTFWPRAAHPLSPPCYAERVVPELHTRVDWALRGTGVGAPSSEETGSHHNLVVLSGHSQGSAILAALVSRLSRSELTNVRVITYGSQIRALYGRVFPRVFGHQEIGYQQTTGPAQLGDAFPDAGDAYPPPAPYEPPAPDHNMSHADWAKQPLMGRLFLSGSQWANLFRRTDPLGFRVFSDTDQPPDYLVPEVPEATLGDPGPTVLGHGAYQHSLTYRRILARWTCEPVVENRLGTVAVPPLPPP